MKKILFINACVRPESRTYILAQQVLNKMTGIVEEINLDHLGLSPLNWSMLQERDKHTNNHDFSSPMFQYAKQFVNADEIVIAAPYWDLSFPATVKIYFEAVTVCGLSFQYTLEGQAQGLCKANKIIYVTTAGGTIGEYNLGYDYVKAMAHTFYGITDVRCSMTENLDVAGANISEIMKKAIAEIDPEGKI